VTAASVRTRVPGETEPNYVFRIASEPWEFEQIHRLNYRTFVEEIPQHSPNPDGSLIDKFHAENTYMICLHEDELVGMIAVRGNRPFSLDQKLPNLDDLLPPATNICEYRLLSVAPGHRKGRVFIGLVAEVARYCLEKGYDLALISGTTRQAKLYRHIGFEPFGPLVGTGDAIFQPMYLTLATAERRILALLAEPWAPFGQNKPASNGLAQPTGTNGHGAGHAPVNLLPGPVQTSPAVQAAFAGVPISHRAEHFAALFTETKDRLRSLTRANRVEVLMGTGTLANDVVCAQLSLLPGSGVVLSNGEFGERLIDHARRFGLDFEPVRVPWGESFNLAAVAEVVRSRPSTQWLWAVHGETSTGVLNDLPGLKAIAAEHGIKLAVDCISTIGTLPVDLTGIYLASGVSGKGLASFPGLSFVFADHEVEPSPDKLPRYLDLGAYVASDGIPYTISSNLVLALHTALGEIDERTRFTAVARLSASVRNRLEAAGLTVVAPPDHAAPAVLTIALPADLDSDRVGSRLREAGYLLSYQSRYLLDRNWIQICLMGSGLRATDLDRLCDMLPELVVL
jgi:aspartate aminotransferase-like enzyme